jgi:myo-inositol-1(or 4)-monophosphatase
MHPQLNIALRAARSASAVIVRSIQRLDTLQITEKQQHDFATEVDRQSEQIIIDTIRQAYPRHGILAEESGKHSGDETVWIIDPLDGTTNYIHGLPHFAVSIAIQHKGRIEHGLIFDPIRQETFIASRGEGARLNDRRIRVSNRTGLPDSLLGTGFPFREFAFLGPYLNILKTLIPAVAGIRRAGSAALDLAYVAAGRLDGFWEFGLAPWDIAAGALLIQEAGGFVSDCQGGEDYLHSGNIVAGAPKVFKPLLQTVRAELEAIN